MLKPTERAALQRLIEQAKGAGLSSDELRVRHAVAAAIPLGTADLMWFYERYLTSPADGSNPLFSVLRTPSLVGLAPATVITADIDPLRSEGRYYAERLADAGVAVDHANYPGVTHEFFGMGAVLDVARSAVARAAADLKAAFAQAGT